MNIDFERRFAEVTAKAVAPVDGNLAMTATVLVELSRCARKEVGRNVSECQKVREFMPILTAETDLFPVDLFENELLLADPERRWWVLYTRSRMEKELMRRLRAMEVPFYGPTIEKRSRTPGGRMQRSFLPLFPNYVFMLGTAAQRYAALTTNCLSRDIPVTNGTELESDLRQLRRLILTGVPLVAERCLETGVRVRVRTGPLAGQEGIVLQRRGDSRLLVAVRFLQQGASVQLDEYELERVP